MLVSTNRAYSEGLAKHLRVSCLGVLERALVGAAREGPLGASR